MFRTRIIAFVKLARVYFLVGTGIAFLIGALMARRETGKLDWFLFVVSLLVVWLVQLTTHFFNEYFDQPTDRLNPRRTLFTGGSGVLVDGVFDSHVALWAGVVALALAVLFFLLLTRAPAFGFATAILFGLALAGAISYSVPPLALANRGWGEADTAAIVALLVPLFAYNLQTGRVSLVLILTCLPFAALVMANMLNVAFPDYEPDQSAGKRTLVVILRPERAARLYSGLLIAGYLAPWLTLGWGLPLPVLLAETATIPFGLASLGEVRRGGFHRVERFWINTFLGVRAVIAVGAAEVVGFLLTPVG